MPLKCGFLPHLLIFLLLYITLSTRFCLMASFIVSLDNLNDSLLLDAVLSKLVVSLFDIY